MLGATATVPPPLPARANASPDHTRGSTERVAVAGDDRPDAPVAEDPEGLAVQRAPHTGLPGAGLERRHLGGNLAHGGQDQGPGQLGRRVRGSRGVQIRGDDNAEARAGVDIDVGIDTALADEAQCSQAFEQWGADGRSLADEHNRFVPGEALREDVDVVGVIVPDRDLMAGQLVEARQRAHRVEPVIEDGDLQ